MAGSEKCFCDKHWQAMRGCGFFNARVWLGCLEAGITLIETYRLTEAEAQLVKAFIAGKLFFREHSFILTATMGKLKLSSTMNPIITPILYLAKRQKQNIDQN